VEDCCKAGFGVLCNRAVSAFHPFRAESLSRPPIGNSSAGLVVFAHIENRLNRAEIVAADTENAAPLGNHLSIPPNQVFTGANLYTSTAASTDPIVNGDIIS